MFRAKPVESSYNVENLSSCRVNGYLLFTNVGGFFFIKDRKGRGAKVTRACICVFMCLRNKAVHLELVVFLTTDGFFPKRFTVCQSHSSQKNCDNGSNFLSARRKLRSFINFFLSRADLFKKLFSRKK